MGLQIYKKVTVDVYDKKIVTVYAKQYDNTARFLEILCTYNSNPYKVSKFNQSAYIRYKKPDDTYVFNSCVITDDGTILVDLTDQMLSVAGNCYCDILLVDTSDEEVKKIVSDTEKMKAKIEGFGALSTMQFIINVLPSPIPYKEIASTDDYSALNELVSKANKNYDYVVDLASGYADKSKASAEHSEEIKEATQTIKDNAISELQDIKDKTIQEATDIKNNTTKAFEDIKSLAVEECNTIKNDTNDIKTEVNALKDETSEIKKSAISDIQNLKENILAENNEVKSSAIQECEKIKEATQKIKDDTLSDFQTTTNEIIALKDNAKNIIEENKQSLAQINEAKSNTETATSEAKVEIEKTKSLINDFNSVKELTQQATTDCKEATEKAIAEGNRCKTIADGTGFIASNIKFNNDTANISTNPTNVQSAIEGMSVSLNNKFTELQSGVETKIAKSQEDVNTMLDEAKRNNAQVTEDLKAKQQKAIDELHSAMTNAEAETIKLIEVGTSGNLKTIFNADGSITDEGYSVGRTTRFVGNSIIEDIAVSTGRYKKTTTFNADGSIETTILETVAET